MHTRRCEGMRRCVLVPFVLLYDVLCDVLLCDVLLCDVLRDVLCDMLRVG